MIQIFSLMMFLGSLCFILLMVSSVSHIDGKNKLLQKVFFFLGVLGLIAFLIGVVGVFWINYLYNK